MKKIEPFKEEDLKIIVPFLEKKGCLPNNSNKKLDIEPYFDNGNMSIVVPVYKKSLPLSNSVSNKKVISVYELRANEDYELLKNLENDNQFEYISRNIYYPDFKTEYLQEKNAITSENEM